MISQTQERIKEMATPAMEVKKQYVIYLLYCHKFATSLEFPVNTAKNPQ